jgi:hypothetical protein
MIPCRTREMFCKLALAIHHRRSAIWKQKRESCASDTVRINYRGGGPRLRAARATAIHVRIDVRRVSIGRPIGTPTTVCRAARRGTRMPSDLICISSLAGLTLHNLDAKHLRSNRRRHKEQYVKNFHLRHSFRLTRGEQDIKRGAPHPHHHPNATLTPCK